MTKETVEARLEEEIASWLDEPPGFVTKMGHRLGRPLARLAGRMLSTAVQERLHSAFEAALLKISDVSQFSFTVASVLEPFQRRGYDPRTLADIRALPLSVCDEIAQEYIRSNRLLSALEGGGLGLGGAAMIAADVPALMSINFRMLSQMANSYGYNSLHAGDRIFLLQIFALAGAEAGGERRRQLQRLQDIVSALDEQMDGTQASPAIPLVKLVQELAEKLALRLAHRKLGQLIPLIGAGIGAGMNYQFTVENGRAALVALRRRRLDEGRGPARLTPPRPLLE